MSTTGNFQLHFIPNPSHPRFGLIDGTFPLELQDIITQQDWTDIVAELDDPIAGILGDIEKLQHRIKKGTLIGCISGSLLFIPLFIWLPWHISKVQQVRRIYSSIGTRMSQAVRGINKRFEGKLQIRVQQQLLRTDNTSLESGGVLSTWLDIAYKVPANSKNASLA
jgi:hypothetical protein